MEAGGNLVADEEFPELKFTIAPGVGHALSGMEDTRAYYHFFGDLNQLGQIYKALLEAGFPVVKNNVYPGFPKDQEDIYIQALDYVFKNRVTGWWNQRAQLLVYQICTKDEFDQALEQLR